MKTGIFALILTLTSFLVAREEPQSDRGIQAAREMVRGDSGKWNDTAILQVVPPPSQKPQGMNLDTWGDQLLESPAAAKAGEETWLLFRSRQLDDNDRIWVETVAREGNQITVTMREAIWQGNYFKTFTYYGVLAVNLGELPAGEYQVNWIVEPLVFREFDGDGRPQSRNGQPQNNWPKDATQGKDEAVVVKKSFAVED